jgi:Tol biopolymer transport system component
MRPFVLGLLPLAVSLVVAGTAGATFPGQNGEIAYTVAGRVWVINPDGSDAHAITGNACAENVAWSPDGRQIAFDDGEGCGGSPYTIFVMKADGSNLRALTGAECGDVQPAWSPDGKWIAFRRTPGPGGALTPTCNNELWTMRAANGRDQQQLTNDGANANAADPTWSPDGSKIAFYRYNRTWQIFVLDLTTGVETDIDRTGGIFADSDPDWSPDGSKITFTRLVSGLGNEIAVMNADGSNQTVLTSAPGNGDIESKWSPDGTNLAYIQAVGLQGLFTMNPNGTGSTPLGTGAVDNHSISWRSCSHRCP